MRAKASSWKREPFAAGDASDAGAEVEEALMSSAQNQAAMDLEYGAQLLDFLISNLLLGQSKPFPRPAAVKETDAGSLSASRRWHGIQGDERRR